MRLLFVDDDPGVGQSFARVWRQAGIEVTVLQEPLALETALSTPFDVVVSDFSMPHRNGLEVLAIVRERLPRAIRALVSGSFGPVEKLALGQIEPVRRATKPISQPDLLALVAVT